MNNHNESVFQVVQKEVLNLTNRRTQVQRDIENAEINLEAMRKELTTLEQAILKSQGALSLIWTVNNSNYIITDNVGGEKVELGQPQVNLQTGSTPQQMVPPQPQAPVYPQPQAAPTPQPPQPTQTQPVAAPQPITPQAQQSFAPVPQGQIGGNTRPMPPAATQPPPIPQRPQPPYNPSGE